MLLLSLSLDAVVPIEHDGSRYDYYQYSNDNRQQNNNRKSSQGNNNTNNTQRDAGSCEGSPCGASGQRKMN